MFQALDGAVKQYKSLSPSTACMFVSVDKDNGKILCMSAVPKVGSTIGNTRDVEVYTSACYIVEY